MQSHDFGTTCRRVESNAPTAPFSSIDEALFAALEMANRSDEPCLMCGLAADEPDRWARGTTPIPIAEPPTQVVESCEPDMIFATGPAPLQSSQPKAKSERNIILVALGALLMAVGAQYVLTSLGMRR